MNPEQVAEAVPVEALSAWITANVPSASGPVAVSHLSGGSSNLTFRVRDDANDWVLRRPPMGRLLATANDMGRAAEKGGAAGLLLLPPYLVNAEQEGLAHYVEAVCRGVGLPVIAYSRDNGVLRVPTLLRLADSCTNLVCVKDGTGDLYLVLETRRRLDWRLVVINGAPTAEMLAAQSFAIGVTAYSSAVFAFAPAIAKGFYDAVAAGDRARQDDFLKTFYFPYSVLRRRRAGNAVSIVKAGLKATGQAAGPVRPPLLDLPDADCAELERLVEAGIALAESRQAA